MWVFAHRGEGVRLVRRRVCGPGSATCVTATRLFLHREVYKDGALNFADSVGRRPQKPKTAYDQEPICVPRVTRRCQLSGNPPGV